MTSAADSMEVLGDETQVRLVSELHAALRRRPAQEARLAGVVRALAPVSRRLRAELLAALDTMVRRGSFERPLYAAVARSLAESGDPGACELIARALSTEENGGLATLSAACFCKDQGLSEPLARAAVSRHAHIAFAAELARLSRGESNGSSVASIAPKIKESHRISLCLELLVPLLSAKPLPRGIAASLRVLRDAERHLGRWLVLAETAVRSGDSSSCEHAKRSASDGAPSARAAWSLVWWALAPDTGSPSARPTIELMARLSDRPSADKDTTFLFRLATARVPSARPMLESLAKTAVLGDECAVRAMLHLYQDYGQERYLEQLSLIARTPKKDVLRALAAAALHDSGQSAAALATTEALSASRHLPALAWCGLIRARQAGNFVGRVVTEARYRRLQLGWVE